MRNNYRMMDAVFQFPSVLKCECKMHKKSRSHQNNSTLSQLVITISCYLSNINYFHIIKPNMVRRFYQEALYKRFLKKLLRYYHTIIDSYEFNIITDIYIYIYLVIHFTAIILSWTNYRQQYQLTFLIIIIN